MKSALFLALIHMVGSEAALAIGPAAGGEIPEITITTADYTFSAPAEIPSGLVSVVLENEGKEPHHVQFARLKEGVTIPQFQQALQAGLEEAVKHVFWVGGPSVVDGGGSGKVTLQLEPGTHMLLCFVPDAEGVPHLAHGMVGAMEVVENTAAATETPSADLTVSLLDFSYAFSSDLDPGPQTWEIVNDGEAIHEISLVKLAEGATMDDVTHFMHTMEGPPPFTSMGGMQAIDPGTTGWLHLDLTAGNYIAICHIPDLSSGQTHAQMGMVMPFSVE